MFKVQNESLVCVLTADMFATPLTIFELLLYVTEFVNLLAEALFPPPSHTCPFNKLVLEILDIEKQ